MSLITLRRSNRADWTRSVVIGIDRFHRRLGVHIWQIDWHIRDHWNDNQWVLRCRDQWLLRLGRWLRRGRLVRRFVRIFGIYTGNIGHRRHSGILWLLGRDKDRIERLGCVRIVGIRDGIIRVVWLSWLRSWRIHNNRRRNWRVHGRLRWSHRLVWFIILRSVWRIVRIRGIDGNIN